MSNFVNGESVTVDVIAEIVERFEYDDEQRKKAAESDLRGN
jgi:hypothetical protein